MLIVMVVGGLWPERGISDFAASSSAEEQRVGGQILVCLVTKSREREGRASARLAQNLRSFEGQTQCRLPVLLSSGVSEPIRSLAGFLIGTVLMFFFLSPPSLSFRIGSNILLGFFFYFVLLFKNKIKKALRPPGLLYFSSWTLVGQQLPPFRHKKLRI